MNFYSLGWFFAVGAWYFEELLNPLAIAHSSVPPAEPILDDFFLDLPMYAPTNQGIRKALSWLRNHKASGIDQVSNEELGCGGEASLDLLTPLFEKVWNIEEVPSDWLKGVITKIETRVTGPTVRTTVASHYAALPPSYSKWSSSRGCLMVLNPCCERINVASEKVDPIQINCLHSSPNRVSLGIQPSTIH